MAGSQAVAHPEKACEAGAIRHRFVQNLFSQPGHIRVKT
jgi:hypothetical protein